MAKLKEAEALERSEWEKEFQSNAAEEWRKKEMEIGERLKAETAEEMERVRAKLVSEREAERKEVAEKEAKKIG